MVCLTHTSHLGPRQENSDCTSCLGHRQENSDCTSCLGSIRENSDCTVASLVEMVASLGCRVETGCRLATMVGMCYTTLVWQPVE